MPTPLTDDQKLARKRAATFVAQASDNQLIELAAGRLLTDYYNGNWSDVLDQLSAVDGPHSRAIVATMLTMSQRADGDQLSKQLRAAVSEAGPLKRSRHKVLRDIALLHLVDTGD